MGNFVTKTGFKNTNDKNVNLRNIFFHDIVLEILFNYHLVRTGFHQLGVSPWCDQSSTCGWLQEHKVSIKVAFVKIKFRKIKEGAKNMLRPNSNRVISHSPSQNQSEHFFSFLSLMSIPPPPPSITIDIAVWNKIFNTHP